jgi:predicted heme/steroid binding protein/uncharacterized membrane protein
MKEIGLEELHDANGEAGKRTYVACRGRIYDVSLSRLWKGGLHMKRHQAGRDLSADIAAAPHGVDILERYPQVGMLKAEGSEDEMPLPPALSALIRRFPFLRRHPHPMTVHFPIVFVLSSFFFNLLYLATWERSFEMTALHCLAGGLLFTPVAMLTGLLSWRLNYLARPMKPVKIKIRLSVILFVVSAILLAWRIYTPDVLALAGASRVVYLVLSFALVPLVSMIGWLGAGLTFPIDKA